MEPKEKGGKRDEDDAVVNFRLLMKDENCSQRFRERKYNVDCK
jgi:hypothetical protein